MLSRRTRPKQNIRADDAENNVAHTRSFLNNLSNQNKCQGGGV
jgi:hypothetical protein